MHGQLWLVIVACCLKLSYERKTGRCGPRDVCSCTTSAKFGTTMDCRGSRMNISDICSICDTATKSNVTYITALDVSNVINNNRSVIPRFCFKGNRCKSLRKLSMSGNGITVLEDFALSNITELEMLDLDKNSLTINGTFISPEIFTDLPNLEVLRLQANTAKQAPPGVTYMSNVSPQSFPKLRELYLDGTEIMSFGTNFRNFLNLRKIDFTGKYARCNIVALNSKTFENTPQVRHLNLALCNLSYIDCHTFETLSNLNYLNLSNVQ